MKKTVITLFFILINYTTLMSQTANWSAVLPDKFPTNASGQIHGISRVSQMKFHPSDPNKLYAVSARGGLFISSDAGNNWTVTPGTDFMAYARLASVCIDFTDDQIIYLGTGDHNYYYSGNGVMKSVNGGLTFSQTALTGRLVVDMIMDPADHNVIVAVTDAGIYKTTNAGSSWALKTASREFDDLKQKTPTSRVLYAATTDSAFFRSTDFGDTWTQITSGIVLPAGITSGNGCRIAVTPADTNVVYLGMVANSGIIYKSTDGGTTFSSIKTSVPPYLTYYSNSSTSSGQGDYNFAIGADRFDPNILYLVAHNVWKSTNGGATWTQLTNWYQKVHTDMHQIVTSPYNNNNLYNMNDGGVWLSTDGGNNWVPKSDGIYGYEIYHGNCSPTRKDMFSIGTQDNGELYATSSGWYTNRGGDWGSQCAFDYRTNSSMVYYFQNNKRRLVNGSDATYGLPAQVTLLNDITFHRSNPDLAFVADTFIYRSTNLTAATPAWTQIANLSKKIMAMHCGFSDANRLYVITNDAMIHVSTNALAASPSFTSYALPNATNNKANITSIKSNPNVLYATLNTKVFRSADNGITWTNISYNLPSVNHVRIISDEYYSSNELVMVASGNAVYYKTGTANYWSLYASNLPTRTDAIDLSIFNDSTANTSLRYASYGRGMWETSITPLRTLNANFAADNTNPCTGQQVNFSDLSTGDVISRTWTFTGGTPSTSTLINPVVTYNTYGIYTVTLTVSDGTTSTTVTKTNYINTNGANLPVNEGFEGSESIPAGWKNIDNSTGGVLWAKTNLAGGYGTSANSMMFDNYSWNNQGEKDELVVKRLDFTGYNSAKLTFDIAYQVFSGYSDSLAVLVSTDCGNTYTKIYNKGGITLSTAGSGGNNFVPAPGQWRTDTINLNAYLGQPGVTIAFQNVNGYGNKLYIDNININATVAANAGPDKTICAGSSTTIGSTSLPGINYTWTPAIGLSSTTVSNPVASPTSLKIYTLTATHALSGIFNKDTVFVFVNNVVTGTSQVNVSCNGGTNGSASVSGSSGTPPYSYLWSTGANVNSISNLAAGTYTVTVTDAIGCSKSAQVTITQPSVLSLTATGSATTCGLANGSVILNVTGGTPAYSYQWSNGITSDSFTNAAAGTYTVTVTDSKGCTNIKSTIVNSSSGVNGISVSSITSTSATISWNVSPDAVTYNLRYRITGSGTWILVTGITSANYLLSSLTASTSYDLELQSDCGNGISAFTPTVNFATNASGCTDSYEPNNTGAAAKPIALNTDIFGLISPSSDKDFYSIKNTLAKPNIKVMLTNLPANYDLQLIKSVVLATSANTGLSNETIIYNTTVKGTYKVKVYRKAGANNATQCYTLKAEISATPYVPKEGDVVVIDDAGGILVYPNPATDEITVQLDQDLAGKTIEINLLNELGQSLKKLSVSNTQLLKLNISDVPSGIYQLRIIGNDFQVNRNISIVR